MPYLEALGFHLAASAAPPASATAVRCTRLSKNVIVDNDLNVAAVLSGNRNFEARIHQRIKSNFLASPMLVVAFALAGHRRGPDLRAGGLDPNGEPVYLDDIWPTNEEIEKPWSTPT
jgi:aconitate hydratase